MKGRVKVITLDENKERVLRSIKAPVTVAVPPQDAIRNLCMMPDGEIRFYGETSLPDSSLSRCYISSKDHGLNWEEVLVSDPDELGAMVRNPYNGEWLSVEKQDDHTCAFVSRSGPGGKDKEVFPVSTLRYDVMRQVIFLRSRNRAIVTTQKYEGEVLIPVLLISDDNGRTWCEKELKTLGLHKAEFPHKGARWQQYACEPTMEELNSGTLMLVVRTTLDHHYVYYSADCGETWSDPEPLRSFYTCNTMPLLKRMNDGRLLFFWCNTQPLPELDHEKDQWGLSPDIIRGRWEDVFTNRDANHCAVSFDDGRSWRGFREIGLNSVRNRADFRSFASGRNRDKSVHQFEALELPYGKILLAYGQAPSSRRLVIFDPEWLLEERRSEDFMGGLENVSTQVYINSISGSRQLPYPGHCSWNRTHGALLIPDPAHDYSEVLQLVTPDDPRLFNSVQGVTWNFPAMSEGEVVIKLRVVGEPLRISLADRWINPCDEYTELFAPFTFTLDKTGSSAAKWTECRIVFNSGSSAAGAAGAEVFIDGEKKYDLALKHDVPAGLSYLICQNVPGKVDFEGTLIKSFAASAKGCGK